jgi:hypothetical protein
MVNMSTFVFENAQPTYMSFQNDPRQAVFGIITQVSMSFRMTLDSKKTLLEQNFTNEKGHDPGEDNELSRLEFYVPSKQGFIPSETQMSIQAEVYHA